MADNDFIVFGKPAIGDEEIAEVIDSLTRGWIGTGPKVKLFERDFAAYQGVGHNHAAAVNSCTAALYLSLTAAGIGPGDEVITTSMTFCATVNAIIHSGATPVLIDIDPETLNLEPSRIDEKITPETKAILVVHFAGRPCPMEQILHIAKRNNLMLIEDCAHAVEARYQGKPAGTFGDFGCYSFYATKNMTTAEGGMILGKDRKLMNRAKTLSLHGMSQDAWQRFGNAGYKHYRVQEFGFKYNLTDLAASLGIHQLKKAEANWRRRADLWNYYMREFEPLPVVLPAAPEPDTRHAFHLFTIQLTAQCVTRNRDDALDLFTALGIGVGVHYLSIPEHPYYQKKFGWTPADFPNATRYGRSTISLPLSPSLTQNQIGRVVEAVCRIAGP